jgi:hypothetical protein
MRLRRQLFVDPKVQGAILLRAAGYWFLSLAIMALLLFDWQILVNPGQPFYAHFNNMWHWYGPVAGIATLILLPLTAFDSVRLSNRFAGPVFRLRRELRRLAAGEQVKPIKFREGDFWQDLADEFNAVNQRIEALNEKLREAQFASRQPPIDTVDLPGNTDNWRIAQLGANDRTGSTPIAGAFVGHGE